MDKFIIRLSIVEYVDGDTLEAKQDTGQGQCQGSRIKTDRPYSRVEHLSDGDYNLSKSAYGKCVDLFA